MACAEAAVAFIQSQAPGFKPKVGLILGSGLGGVSELLEGIDGAPTPLGIPYSDISNFPVSTVSGHAGILYLGVFGGVKVACLKGRCHLYEGIPAEKIRVLIYTLRGLGCEMLLSTAAVGSCREECGPGELVIVTDHINFQGTNPLVGPNDAKAGERFVALEDAYDSELRSKFHQIAVHKNIRLHEGVYGATLGPCFETPAEVRMIKLLGADVVGMSVVGETIAARHCGLRVATIAIVVNLAAGMSEEALTHELTLKWASIAENKVKDLVLGFLTDLSRS